jgi:K+-sensing histidine kinase KdpD
MVEVRPDPDQLLRRVEDEEKRAKRGRLRIFFGFSAGVGKTYAMLGRRARRVPPQPISSSAMSSPTDGSRPSG